MKIYIDNLIFSFQRFGGISSVYNSITRYLKNAPGVELKLLDLKKTRKLLLWRFKVLPFIWINDNKPHIYLCSFNTISLNPKTINTIIIHDLMDEMFKPTWKSYIHIWNKYISLLFTDKIICVSETTRRDLLNVYPSLKTKEITVIHNPIEKPLTIESTKSLKEDYFIYIGNRGKYKGFELTPNLMEITPPSLKLKIIGKPLNSNELILLDRYKKRVEVLENINDNELNYLIKNAKFIFYPSKYEGFGIPPLEAISLGTIALCGNGGALKETCVNSNIFMFDVNNVETLKIQYNKLRQHNFDKAKADELLGNYDPEIVGERYLKFMKC